LKRNTRREQIHWEQRGKCYYCACHMVLGIQKPGERADEFLCTEDHLTPVSMGGSDQRDNVVGACFLCNNIRGTISYDAFKWFVKTYGRGAVPMATYRSLAKTDTSPNLKYWLELLKPNRWAGIRAQGVTVDCGPIKVPTVPNAAIPPYVPTMNSRRRFLVMARRHIHDIVYGIPYYERNTIWLNYLREEKASA
jgi:hypothetical protein